MCPFSAGLKFAIYTPQFEGGIDANKGKGGVGMSSSGTLSY